MSKIQLKHGTEELPQVPGPSPNLGVLDVIPSDVNISPLDEIWDEIWITLW